MRLLESSIALTNDFQIQGSGFVVIITNTTPKGFWPSICMCSTVIACQIITFVRMCRSCCFACQIIGEISVAGATYKAMEFVGSAVEGMNMDERMTMCNMVVEAGGKNGVIAPDQTTFDYVRARTADAFEPVYTDANAKFCADYK